MHKACTFYAFSKRRCFFITFTLYTVYMKMSRDFLKFMKFIGIYLA